MQSVVPLKSSHLNRLRFSWLFGRNIDLGLFYAPIILAFAAVSLSHDPAINQSLFLTFLFAHGFGLGPFHIGITYFHYLDRRNLRAYMKPENITHAFLLPALSFIVTVPLFCCAPSLLAILTIWVSMHHTTQQNIGFLMLYQNHDKNEIAVDRQTTFMSLHAVTLLFGMVFFHNCIRKGPLVACAIDWGMAISGIIAAAFVYRYLAAMFKQYKVGRDLNVPAVAFWLLSAMFYVPFLIYGKNISQGMAIGTFVHLFQYIGLNFILAKRKYSRDENAEQLLVPLKPLMLLAVCGLAWLALNAILFAFAESMRGGLGCPILMGLITGVGVQHFVQDTYIWKLRFRHNREAILPYLKPATADTQNHQLRTPELVSS